MKSKDLITADFRAKLQKALNGEDPNAVVEVFTQYAEDLQKNILADYENFQQTNDSNILASRGVRQLTAEEKKFYQAFVSATETGDLKQAFEGLENAYPETVINSVLENMRSEFPLLAEIDLVGASSLVTKMLKNGSSAVFAEWGEINSNIKGELAAKIDLIDITLCKLTAWIPISKDMLQAGLNWLDAYVRALLVEAAGNALCKAAVDGDGKTSPIGMMRDCSSTASVVGGVYPRQTAIKIDDLSVETFCALYAALAKDSLGKSRTVNGVVFVVNPTDYYLRILPKIAYRNAAGEYVYTIPLPIKFIQEPTVEEGLATIGIGKGYFLGVGYGGKNGAIDFDDSYKFLEDLRTYATKIHANGCPKDSNNFILLDISALPAVELTDLADTEETPEE